MEKKYIALTFDDGPNETTTGEVLVKLLKYNVVASFFLIGNQITPDTYDMVRNAYEMGCELNNHSMTHTDMTTLTKEQIEEEVNAANHRIEEITGQIPCYFRPPYLSTNDLLLDSISMPIIGGDGYEETSLEVSAKEYANRMLTLSKPGGILMLHDFEGNRKMVHALDFLIPELLREGYTFVTISELLKWCQNSNVIINKKVHMNINGN